MSQKHQTIFLNVPLLLNSKYSTLLGIGARCGYFSCLDLSKICTALHATYRLSNDKSGTIVPLFCQNMSVLVTVEARMRCNRGLMKEIHCPRLDDLFKNIASGVRVHTWTVCSHYTSHCMHERSVHQCFGYLNTHRELTSNSHSK